MTHIEPNENWTGARAVLHPEFLRKTKTPQNDSGTIIARHIVNLNPSRHVYRHFKTEIRRAKLIYTARTIVERGILPTVSKTHFTPLEKKTFPRKTAAWGESKNKWVGFLRWNRKQKNRVAGRARGSRKMANFYARKLSRGSFRYKKKLRIRMKPEKIQHDRSPKLSGTNPSRFQRLSGVLSGSRRATATFFPRSFSSRTLGELVLDLHPSHWRPPRGDLHDLLLLLGARITRSIIMERASFRAKWKWILRNHKRCVRGIKTSTSLKRITAAR